jgi:type III secretion system YscQ/HrcQ family protein
VSLDVSEAAASLVPAGTLGPLPRLSSRQVQLEARLSRLALDAGFPAARIGLDELIGSEPKTGRAEVIWRASGLGRPGLVAQLTWPRLGTRLGFGVETPLAHAVVDRMLGFDRLEDENRLQLTPVEWGILTFVVARGLARLDDQDGPLGPWELILDRVGPDPFDPRDLGPIVTIRWPVRVGTVTGSVRLWLPESLVAPWLASEPPPVPGPPSNAIARFGALAGTWRAEGGTLTLTRGLRTLRVGGVLPLIDSRLQGPPANPSGPIELALGLSSLGGRYRIPAEPAPFSGGGRLTLTGPLRFVPMPREAIPVNPSAEPTPTPATTTSTDTDPTDVPVTLAVELGRINLPLRRLADLKPGDVLELGRHSREPIELTSGGRLVARGELVQIDTELGVRVTNIFL